MKNPRLNKYQISGGYCIVLQIDLVFGRTFFHKSKFGFVMPVCSDDGMFFIQLSDVFLQREQSLPVVGVLFLLQCQCF